MQPEGACPAVRATDLRKSGLRLMGGTARTKDLRRPAIEIVRFAAAAVIVLFHAKLPVGGFMVAAVGFFTMTVALFAAKCRQQPQRPWLERRVRRLLLPFLVWFVIALAMKLADALASGGALLSELAAWVPPNGTLGQLWFLPFAFVVSQTVATLPFPRLPEAPWAGLAAFALALALSLLWLAALSQFDMPNGVQVFVGYIPAALIGAALLPLLGQPRALAAATIAGLATGLAALALGLRGSEQIFVALPVLAACFVLPVRAAALGAVLGAASLPLYLVHVSLIAVALRLVPYPIGSLAFAATTLAASAACALVWVIARPLLRPRLAVA